MSTKKLGKWFVKTDLRKNWGLYLLLIPALIAVAIFSYFPMVGIIIAFEKFDPMKGMFGSTLVGLTNFKFFFQSSEWLQVTVNTLYLNVLFIFTGTIFSVFIAIAITEFTANKALKISQTLMTLPNFVSWSTLALFMVPFLRADGLINGLLELLHIEQISFFSNPKVWPALFVFLRIWKGAGWGSIIIIASIMGIDPCLYEAARIDGASRFQIVFKIKLPFILDVIVLTLLLSLGNMFRGDLGMIYPFVGDNALLFPTTDVIDTYVFRTIRMSNDFGRTAAVGLFQSVLGFVLVLLSNWFAKRYAPSAALF